MAGGLSFTHVASLCGRSDRGWGSWGYSRDLLHAQKRTQLREVHLQAARALIIIF
jgi:cytochrome b